MKKVKSERNHRAELYFGIASEILIDEGDEAVPKVAPFATLACFPTP